MLERNLLLNFLETELQATTIRDYCPNGLQVEGKLCIKKIVTGVTASQALLDAAVAAGADAILVHHGYFWKNEPYPVTGIKKRRLQTLLRHDINLIAYHLPLDVHPRMGNNARLGAMLEVQNISAVADVEPRGVLMQGELPAATDLAVISGYLAKKLDREPLIHDAGIGKVSKIAWCTGGGQGYIEQAAAAGAQLFVSGEVSEQTIHLSRELGIHFIAAGHHATERYGVKALGEFIASHFDVAVEFIDIDNPA